MKKIFTLFFGITCMLSVATAQDITVFDFDGVTPTTFDSWSDTFTSEANPLSDAVNTSANVGKYTHLSQWSNVATAVDIDPRVYTSFDIDVYTPSAGTVIVACYDASGNQLNWYSESVSASTGWTKLTHEFVLATKIAKVAVGFNSNNTPVGDASDVAYFDNLVFKKTKNTIITLYTENFFASWSQWGDWTGAPSIEEGKWTGGINLVSTDDGDITIGRDWDAHEGVLKVTPASPTITISNINLTGFTDFQLSFDVQWPYSEGENDAFYASSFAPVIEYNNGGDWTTVSTSALTGDWVTQTIDLTGIVGTNPLSLRIVSLGGITYKLDNLKIQGVQLSSSVATVKDNTFVVYPNPTSDYFYTYNASKVTISDLNGRVLINAENEEKVSVISLDKGIYLVKITTDGVTKAGKLVKE